MCPEMRYFCDAVLLAGCLLQLHSPAAVLALLHNSNSITSFHSPAAVLAITLALAIELTQSHPPNFVQTSCWPVSVSSHGGIILPQTLPAVPESSCAYLTNVAHEDPHVQLTAGVLDLHLFY